MNLPQSWLQKLVSIVFPRDWEQLLFLICDGDCEIVNESTFMLMAHISELGENTIS